MTKKNKLIQIRKRLFTDFSYYSKNSLKIRTKTGEITSLKLNSAQTILQDAIEKQMKSEGKVRIVILKARQQGISTHVGGYFYFNVSQRKAQKCMVVTHSADSTRALFDMTRRYHENCPELLKPHTKYSSRKELSFDVLDSSYVVATAGSEAIGRGETLTHVHASELAFWSPSTAKENWNALLQAVPNEKGTAIIAESTANGLSNIFQELWRGACDGTNGFIPVFIPWFIDDTYIELVDAPLDRTPEEEDLATKYFLRDEQLAFRRKRIAQNGLMLFQQEYPATPEEAFITTGRPVFNPEQLIGFLDEAPKPIAQLSLEGEEWNEHFRGELLVYENIEPSKTYYIGADVSMGIRGGDYSVAQVLSSDKKQVAIYRAQVHPDYFATVLYHLGSMFNDALIAVENNGHGLLTATRLGKDLAYPNFYTEVIVDKLTDKETIKLGFTTSVKTKPLIIDTLRADLREEKVQLYDKITLRELMTFVAETNGTMAAEPGCHDDTVMALALANYVNDGKFKPVEVTSDMYIEMI